MDFTKIKDNALLGLSVAGGIGVAVLLVKQFGDKAPKWALALIAAAPGIALTLFGGNKFLTSAGIGMIGTGALVGAKQLTEGKTGFLATINQNLPQLNGPADDYAPTQSLFLNGLNEAAPANSDLFLN